MAATGMSPLDPRLRERGPDCGLGPVELSGSNHDRSKEQSAAGSGGASRAPASNAALSGNSARFGALDTSYGDAASSRWTLRVVTCGGDEAEALTIELHEESSRSHLLCCLQDTDRWAGDVCLQLPHALWRPAVEPLLRHIYSPQATDYFVETLLLRRTLPEAIGVVHCALYLDVSSSFFPVFYAKVAARRTLLCRSTGDIDSDSFTFPRDHDAEVSWHALPLDHALLWLDALDLSLPATKANLAGYVAADLSLGAAPVEELASKHLEVAQARLVALQAEREVSEKARAARRRPPYEPGMRPAQPQHNAWVIVAPTGDPATAELTVDATLPPPPAAPLPAQPEPMAVVAVPPVVAGHALSAAAAALTTAAQLLAENLMALEAGMGNLPVQYGAGAGAALDGNTGGGQAPPPHSVPPQHPPLPPPHPGHSNAPGAGWVAGIPPPPGGAPTIISAPPPLATPTAEAPTAPPAPQPMPPPPTHPAPPLAAPFALQDIPTTLPMQVLLPGLLNAPLVAPPHPAPGLPAPAPPAPPAPAQAPRLPLRPLRAAPQPPVVDVDDLVEPLEDFPACGSARHLEDVARRAQEAADDTRRWQAIHLAAQHAGLLPVTNEDNAANRHGSAGPSGGGQGGGSHSGGGQGSGGGGPSGSSGAGSFSGDGSSGAGPSDMGMSGDGSFCFDLTREEQLSRSGRSHPEDFPPDEFLWDRRFEYGEASERERMRLAKRLRGEANASRLSEFREVMRARSHHILGWARSSANRDNSDAPEQ
jgi:hypothetical protein